MNGLVVLITNVLTRIGRATALAFAQEGAQIVVSGKRDEAGEHGLIIAEATTVAITGRGWFGAAGIYSDDHIVGWKQVTDAVHARGGRIFLQLWHVGRVSHITMTNGAMPVAPSVVPFEQVVAIPGGWTPVSSHRALVMEEIPGIIEEYHQGAERALMAGFDGVELHGANGYLPDQFLQDGSNKRTDAYGGPVENRARFLLEVTEALISVWGGNRVGVRLAPSGKYNAMSDSNPEVTFAYVAEQLNQFGLAYLHIIEPRVKGSEVIEEGRPPIASMQLRKIFTGKIIAAGGFEPASAEAIIAKGDADLVAFGRHFIANPDLPKRIKLGLPLNAYDRATFDGGDNHGYTDYPFYEEAAMPDRQGRQARLESALSNR
jgi:N-ethylmaleimide reductase